MKKHLILALLAATVASAVLAAPGGAGKPAYSAPCVLGPGGKTTVTWLSGTISAHVVWRDENSSPVGQAVDITVTSHGPDSTVLDTPATNPVPATANVSYITKKLPTLAVGVCALPPP
jgi:hypothetical protein